MVLKRPFLEQEGDSSLGSGVPSEGSKRRLTSAVWDVISGLSLDEVGLKLEPLLRKVVREEVERVFLIHPSPRSPLNQIESSGARDLRLHFVNKLPSTLFTGSRIEAEDSAPLEIVILDASSKNIIRTGPLSSIKIEVVVLDGDFGTDELDDCTEKKFNDHVVREREGKRPLVTGDRVVTLRNGVGRIGDSTFTDNSSWTRSRKFRLGARAVEKTSNEFRIREARSEAFVVKDHRGELYKKHYPPNLGDEVWRLERIAKEGVFHMRLASKGIRTVRDFLRLYVTNPSSLRIILECGNSNRTWETIIEHANTCVLDDDKLYSYYRSAQRLGLLFNSIYRVVGVTFDGQHFQPTEKLNPSQTRLVDELKRLAYRNVSDLVPIEEPSVVGPSRPLLNSQSDLFGSPNLPQQHINFSVTHLGELETQLGFNCSTTSSPNIYELDNSQLEVSVSTQMQVPPQALGYSFGMTDSWSGPYGCGSDWTPSGSLGPAMPTASFPADETWFPINSATTFGQGNSFLCSSSNEEVGIRISRRGKQKARWCKIRAALKWGISVRRYVAARRMARRFYLDY